MSRDRRRRGRRPASRRRIARASLAGCDRSLLVLLLLARSSPSTTWCCCRSGRSSAVAARPGRAVALARRDRPRHLRRGAARPPTTAGRASSPSSATALLVALGTVVLTLLVAIPGCVRRQPAASSSAGGRSASLFLAVYLFPAILLAVPLFVFFTRHRAARLAGRPADRVRRPDRRRSRSTCCATTSTPSRSSLEEAAAIDGCTRLGVMRQISLPLAHAGDRGERAVRLHDRLERVPLRPAVPRRAAGTTGRSRWACPSSPAASRCRPPC